MTRKLVYRRRVGIDLANAYRWYEDQRPGLGGQFLTAVERVFDLIERFPEMYRRVHGEVRRTVVSRFPYAVFFRIDSRRIVVLATVHMARDPALWPK